MRSLVNLSLITLMRIVLYEELWFTAVLCKFHRLHLSFDRAVQY